MQGRIGTHPSFHLVDARRRAAGRCDRNKWQQGTAGLSVSTLSWDERVALTVLSCCPCLSPVLPPSQSVRPGLPWSWRLVHPLHPFKLTELNGGEWPKLVRGGPDKWWVTGEKRGGGRGSLRLCRVRDGGVAWVVLQSLRGRDWRKSGFSQSLPSVPLPSPHPHPSPSQSPIFSRLALLAKHHTTPPSSQPVPALAYATPKVNDSRPAIRKLLAFVVLVALVALGSIRRDRHRRRASQTCCHARRALHGTRGQCRTPSRPPHFSRTTITGPSTPPPPRHTTAPSPSHSHSALPVAPRRR